MNALEKPLPWIVLGLGITYIVAMLIPWSSPGPEDFNLAEFAAIPVMDNGRIKPIDTVARSNLTFITHKQTFRDNNDVRKPAIVWLLDTYAGVGATYKVFRIENDELLAFLGLEERAGFRYAPKEFESRIGALLQRVGKANTKNPSKFEAKAMELVKQWEAYKKLELNQAPLFSAPFRRDKDSWYALDEVNRAGMTQDLSAVAFDLLLTAYEAGNARDFNRVVGLYSDRLKELLPNDLNRVQFEVFFNRFEPFHQASVLYIFAFLLGCLSWLGWSRSLNSAGFYLCILAFLIHTWAIFGRMYILDRPFVFVINLYSSAVFIGWCATGVAIFIEAFYRNSLALVVGSAVAAITAGIIGHYLSLDGDTIVMMQAVLDTNLWLATHVTTVTMGYSATIVAGCLGVVFVILGTCTPLLQRGGITILAKMIYGVVCFATLLSFTGTVLGGIWADQSWGRFWGWDPKENGALLIVIWNALVLHARWGGMIKQRGLAVLSIGGVIVTGWSWFGTNMLGVGLHYYGFMEGVMWAMIAVDVSLLTIMAIGLVPTKYWTSYQQPATGAALSPRPTRQPVI